MGHPGIPPIGLSRLRTRMGEVAAHPGFRGDPRAGRAVRKVPAQLASADRALSADASCARCSRPG
jgi:hypothetical protein